MKIRIELSEKEIRDMAVAIKPMYEIDGFEEHEVAGDRNMKKLVKRICADENVTAVGHGYTGIVGNGVIKFNIDGNAIAMAAQYAAKTMRRFIPLINATIRFVKSMKELVGLTSETLRSDAEEFTKKYNDAFPLEREWKLVTVDSANSACLYERVNGATEWTKIMWTDQWDKVDNAMDVMDLHPSYAFFDNEDVARNAFMGYLGHNHMADANEFTPSVAQPKESSPKQEQDEFDNDLYL